MTKPKSSKTTKKIRAVGQLKRHIPNPSGGNAFPLIVSDTTTRLSLGMSLRDYFAAHIVAQTTWMPLPEPPKDGENDLQP